MILSSSSPRSRSSNRLMHPSGVSHNVHPHATLLDLHTAHSRLGGSRLEVYAVAVEGIGDGFQAVELILESQDARIISRELTTQPRVLGGGGASGGSATDD